MSKLLLKDDCNIKILKDIAQLTLNRAIDNYKAGGVGGTPFNQLYCALEEL